MSGASQHKPWVTGVAVRIGVCIGLALVLSAGDAAARWSWNTSCEDIDAGGGDDHGGDYELREPTQGLQLDPLAPPQYVTRLEQPDRVAFQITAWNDSWRSQAASAVVVLCQSASECTEQSTDLGDWGPLWALGPGERRSALIWTEDPVDLGLHTVSVLLVDDVGTIVDRFHGDPLMVGDGDVRILSVDIDDRKASPRRSSRVKSLDPEVGLALTLHVENQGNAPEVVSAAFVVDGGFERSCGREIYTPAVRVGPGEREQLSAFWADESGKPLIEPGKHILSVLLYDARDALIDTRRGIPISVRSVDR